MACNAIKEPIGRFRSRPRTLQLCGLRLLACKAPRDTSHSFTIHTTFSRHFFSTPSSWRQSSRRSFANNNNIRKRHPGEYDKRRTRRFPWDVLIYRKIIKLQIYICVYTEFSNRRSRSRTRTSIFDRRNRNVESRLDPRTNCIGSIERN